MFRKYSRMSVNAALTRSSSRLSLRFRIHSKTNPRTKQSMTRCFNTAQDSHSIHAGKLRCFLDLHSLPEVICSRNAATSADRFVIARSIVRCHRLLLLAMACPASSSSSSSISMSFCDRLSASSSSLMGFKTLIGASPSCGGSSNRRDVVLALGDASDAVGELCLIWFQTNSSSVTSSLASLYTQCLVSHRPIRAQGGQGEVSYGVVA